MAIGRLPEGCRCGASPFVVSAKGASQTEGAAMKYMMIVCFDPTLASVKDDGG
jgi:hypothetical protein